MNRQATHHVSVVIGVGYLDRFHAAVDRILGRMPDGRPVLRATKALERVGAPGVIVAWAASTGARAAVFGGAIPVLMDAVIPPGPLVVDLDEVIVFARWPTLGDAEAQTNAVGLAITSRLTESGEWEDLIDEAAILERFELQRLTGTDEEMDRARTIALAAEQAASARDAKGVTADVEVGA